jgi:hypothetical protein
LRSPAKIEGALGGSGSWVARWIAAVSDRPLSRALATSSTVATSDSG